MYKDCTHILLYYMYLCKTLLIKEVCFLLITEVKDKLSSYILFLCNIASSLYFACINLHFSLSETLVIHFRCHICLLLRDSTCTHRWSKYDDLFIDSFLISFSLSNFSLSGSRIGGQKSTRDYCTHMCGALQPIRKHRVLKTYIVKK